MKKADIGLIGLAVMGENLALNMLSHGFTVAVYNRTAERTRNFVSGRASGKNAIPACTLAELVESIAAPRRIMLMVRAGEAVDELIGQLVPLLSPGDVIIDGGNSRWQDTGRRCAQCEAAGLLYVGTGVSGGEEGALRGPSLMPGGSQAAWPLIAPVFQSICAKAPDGAPCCGWVGPGGAGHYVKMVHNGIEYGDMQLICEAYQLLREGLGLGCGELSGVFAAWNKTELDSYLIGITADILAHREPDGTPTVDVILDCAGQKGTGKWTVISALDEGYPLTLIGEAVFARCLSSLTEERRAAFATFGHAPAHIEGGTEFVEDVRRALYVSKIISYGQGFGLGRRAAARRGWSLNYGGIALMWRGGCIIRSTLLGHIKAAFDAAPELENLLLDGYFAAAVRENIPSLRRVAAAAVSAGVAIPAFTAVLAYYDGLTSPRLPTALLQAQRDYFGAHTYERVDAPRGERFHTDWAGLGGVSSTAYDA